MRLTLGDEDALTGQTVSETLRRVSGEIKKEESEKLTAEQIAHRKTRDELASERAEKKSIQERVYWRCRRRAKYCARFVSVCVALLLIGGVAAGLGIWSDLPIVGGALIIGSALLTLVTVIDFLVGFSVKEMHTKLELSCRTWLIKREAAAMGLDVGELE